MNEQEKNIRLLLDRFMAGETSLEDENRLGEWFRTHPDVSDELKEYQMMFGYFDDGMPLDSTVKNTPDAIQPKDKPKKRRLWLSVSIAASIALLLGVAIPKMAHQDHLQIAQLDGDASLNKANLGKVDSTTVNQEKATDSYLSMPEKIKNSGDSTSAKPVIRRQKKYRQHMFAPAPPKLLIAQHVATDSLLAEPEMLADAHLREMEEQQNEMFFKLYLINALQTEEIHSDIASASFESEENVHDEDYEGEGQEVY